MQLSKVAIVASLAPGAQREGSKRKILYPHSIAPYMCRVNKKGASRRVEMQSSLGVPSICVGEERKYHIDVYGRRSGSSGAPGIV
jgi:hypothetical protein